MTCNFRYECERGHEVDSAEAIVRCPEPCGAGLVRTLDGPATDPEDGYLSPDERLKKFGRP